MKRIIALLVSILLITGLFAGCGGGSEEAPADSPAEDAVPAPAEEKPEETAPSDVTLTVMINVVGEQAVEFERALEGFQEETGYNVEFSAPGNSYEELMKTKMSANELPDVFSTHGWSVLRYSEYLEPINDMSFAGDIIEQMRPVITDSEGQMYVLPVDADVAGIVYNIDVIEAAGVSVDDIKTWDDFSEACKAVKDSGTTPIHVGGKDDWTIGQFGDYIAPSYFVTNESDNQRDDLKNGIFDAATWEQVAGLMDEWVKAGYYNEDALTADYNATMEAIAENKAAFAFFGNSSIVDARTINPDANLAMMPIPAASADDEPSLIAGERLAVGMWKDTPHKQESIELLEYLARPEVAGPLATASGSIPGIAGVTSEIGDVQESYDKYSDIRTFPYFDREYLPSGLWDVMCATGAEVLGQTPNAVENAGKAMAESFADRFN